jgi:hypothetical protein
LFRAHIVSTTFSHLPPQESPVLRLRRGTKYTFTIKAGPDHPFYLTSSIIGGRGAGTADPNEVVFEGEKGDLFGGPDSPATLTFTPNSSTPDVLYYQCDTHQKLGWCVQEDFCGFSHQRSKSSDFFFLCSRFSRLMFG